MSEAQMFVLVILIGITVLILLEFASQTLKKSKWAVTDYQYKDIAAPQLGNPGQLWPDDPDSLYAQLRAWDRHLQLQGMLPIGTCNPEEVGPILVNPRGDRKYLTFAYTGEGKLYLRKEVLQTHLRKPLSSKGRRIQFPLSASPALQRALFKDQSSGP